MKRFLFLLVLGVAGAALFRAYLFEGIYLKTDSMAPTLPTGMHVFVNKFAYKFGNPERGDVVMFHTPQQPDQAKGLIKRVIAIGGDTIEIKNKSVILNGRELHESYVQNVSPHDIFIGDNLPEIKVPAGFVVVLGDNRDVSQDSRDWKDASGNWSPYVPVEDIQGRVVLPN